MNVPIFTQMRYVDLPADFKAWLALDHSKKQARRKKLSSDIFECVAPGIYLQVRANKGRVR